MVKNLLLKKSKLSILIFLFFTSVLCDSYASPSEKVITVGIGDWMPWQRIVSKDRATGILPEIFSLLMKDTGYNYKFADVPNIRRNETMWGKNIDVELGVIPQWRKKYENVSVYTDTVFTTVNVVLARKNTFNKANSIKKFYGKTIATNIGYYYTDGFEEAFKGKRILRSDSPEGSSIVEKLQGGRVDAIIIDRYEANYWITKLGYNKNDFEETYVFKNRTNLKFRFHIKHKEKIPKINQSIYKLRKKGFILQIVKKYTE